MAYFIRLVMFLVSAVVSALSPLAQASIDVSGHWEGVIQAPEMMVNFEVDFARNGKGELIGTINLPAENIHGLPLTRVKVDGSSVMFQARSDQPLTGAVSADGKSIAGDMTASGGTAPFTMTRTGEPRIEAAVKQAPITTPFEGTWQGTIQSRMGAMRLQLHLANQDGASTARVVNLDQGSLEIPATTIAQDGATLTLDFKNIGASYAATLSADGAELNGSFSQAKRSVPLVFRRASQ
jgi:hypothetical protein